MGTFHQNKHWLHGMTIAVQAAGDRVFIGRCDDMNEQRVVLVDVEAHREGDGGLGNDEFLRRAALVGHRAAVRRIALPASQVLSLKLLQEIEPN